MAPSGAKYPQHLNPFGDEDEEEVNNKIVSNPKALTSDEYPADLDPFGEDGPHVEDYDDSLNPFGDETTASDVKRQNDSELVDEEASSNPFADDIEKELDKQLNNEKTNANVNLQSDIATNFDSLEPPKPLPRTKSLLKKEQHRRRLQELQQQTENTNIEENTPQSASTSDLQVDVKNLSSETIDGNKTISLGTSQARKQKRLAPPVPVNFKRQVIGSLDAIEEELNDIGDKLAIIDKESAICQEILVAPNEDINPDTTRSKFIELIKRRNTFVRRQKELMYTKRELKLDQLHSDIEYELRMIGNKQRKLFQTMTTIIYHKQLHTKQDKLIYSFQSLKFSIDSHQRG